MHGVIQRLSSYTKVYSVIYDSRSVPQGVIYSPRETSPEVVTKGTLRPTNPESITQESRWNKSSPFCPQGLARDAAVDRPLPQKPLTQTSTLCGSRCAAGRMRDRGDAISTYILRRSAPDVMT